MTQKVITEKSKLVEMPILPCFEERLRELGFDVPNMNTVYESIQQEVANNHIAQVALREGDTIIHNEKEDADYVIDKDGNPVLRYNAHVRGGYMYIF